MKMKKFCLAVIAIVCLALPTQKLNAEYFSSEALVQAEAYVAVIDSGDFEQAYRKASRYLQLTQPIEEWLREQNRTRQLLGAVLERQLKTIRARDAYPGLPDGDYLIVCYEARTGFKQEAIEVLLLKQEAGEWLICKYSIR
jgi:hypothetical protein